MDSQGIFIFDVWYLPAVLRQMPEKRIKKVSNENIEVIRIATPHMRINQNIVDVHYKMMVKELNKENYSEFEEIHPMRYFSTPEIESYAKIAGFKVIKMEESITGNSPSEKTWSVIYVLKRK